MPRQKDESTVVDLTKLAQAQQRQQPQQRQRQPAASSTTPESSNIFNHLTSLDSPPVSSDQAPSSSSQSTKRHSALQPTKGAKNGEHKDCPRHAEGHLPNKIVRKDLGDRRTLLLFYASDVALFENIMTYKLGNPDRLVDDAIDAFSEHQGADALANIIYGTQAFDMVFKYLIPEYRRKVPNQPPVIPPGPSISDLKLDSNDSATKVQVEDEKQQLKQQQDKAEGKNAIEQLLDVTPLNIEKDIEAAITEHRVGKDEKLKRHRHRFIKSLLRESLIIESEPNIDGDEMYLKIYTPFWRLCVEAQRLRIKMELTQIHTRDETAAAAEAVEKEKKQNWLMRNIFRFLQRADNISLPLRAESLLFKSSKLRQYALAEKTRKWSDIVRHGGGITPNGDGVGAFIGSDGKDGFFGTAQRGRLTESIIIYSKIHTKRGDRHAFKSILEMKAISDVFTLHDGSYKSKVKPIPNRRTLLYDAWVKSRRAQPLEDIRFYYGEKVALYFAWIGYYTKWLVSASIVGALFFVYGLSNYFVQDHKYAGTINPDSNQGTAQRIFDNALTLPYTLFMTVWSTLYVEYWKRRSNTLVYQWNTLDYEKNERARPEFKPTGVRISPVTGKRELYYPRYRQFLSVLISILVVLISIAIVILSVGSLLIFNLWLKKPGEDGKPGIIKNQYGITALTAVLNLVVIMILGTIYSRLASFLTNNENHRRGTQHEDALIIKRYLFDFINFYSTLFYIAYFKNSFGGLFESTLGIVDSCAGNSCMGELTIQLAIVFVGKQFLNQFQEVAIPKLQETWNRKNEIAAKTALQGKYLDMKKMKKPPQWAKDDALPKTDATMFEEYRELVIQFGFCTLFVTAFPVAPIFALLNNVLEIRVDAYKLLTRHRRPIAQPVQDIGSWSTIMVFITYISVWTNACLIAFQSDWMEINVFRKVSWVQADVGDHTNYGLLAVRLLFIFIFEHVVFLAKAFISKLVRDVPRTVKLAIDRENYYTRLALDDEEPAVDEALEDLDDDEDESEDEDDFRKKLLNLEESVEERAAAVAANLGIGEDEVYDEEEEAEELEALIKAGGCGCAARGDGILGTVKGGFDATWMSRFRPEAAQAVLRRRQQRRRKKQNAQAKNGKEE